MRRRELEIRLESVEGFADPDPSLEQYVTPAPIAADIVFEAFSRGDVEGMKVLDLGCGTGMLSVAASLAGAGMVVGYDSDPSALDVARRNASALGCDVEFRLSDVLGVAEGADTVIMNPPLGCQSPHADRPFLEKALALADCVYSVHMAETAGFVESFCEARGRGVFWRRTYKYEIPHLFSFHTREKSAVDVVAVGIR